ncbi:MAG TPA: hypothetical protein VFK94_02155 [Patescibacteria group bacterium]|nr:hypothetical protein [Patescibacteria group bacterium]
MLSVVEAREQNIIAALQEPLTMEELRDVIGVNIYTLRKDMQRLGERGIIKPTGMVRDRKPTYVVASKRPVPELYRKRRNEYISPLIIQRNYAFNPAKLTPSMKAARYLNDAIDNLLQLSVEANDTAHDNKAIAEELTEVRANLQESYLILSEVTDMIQQLLSNPTWWSPSSIKAIKNDPEWNEDDILTAHSRIISGRLND